MKIDIWSDVVCPWCAIGKAHLDAALSEFEHAAEIELTWRSFELNPGAPAQRDGAYGELLGRKYGVAPAVAQGMIDTMNRAGAEAGLDFHLEQARPGNSFDAHRLIHLGQRRGLQTAVKERLLRAYLCEGQLVSDHETLRRLGVEAGLEDEEVAMVLASGAYGGDVREDEAEASRLDITAVPTFVVDDRLMIPGAQGPEMMLRVLRRAWDSRTAVTISDGGLACGPEGCPV